VLHEPHHARDQHQDAASQAPEPWEPRGAAAHPIVHSAAGAGDDAADDADGRAGRGEEQCGSVGIGDGGGREHGGGGDRHPTTVSHIVVALDESV
jgi:hypothetical protein